MYEILDTYVRPSGRAYDKSILVFEKYLKKHFATNPISTRKATPQSVSLWVTENMMQINVNILLPFHTKRCLNKICLKRLYCKRHCILWAGGPVQLVKHLHNAGEVRVCFLAQTPSRCRVTLADENDRCEKPHTFPYVK